MDGAAETVGDGVGYFVDFEEKDIEDFIMDMEEDAPFPLNWEYEELIMDMEEDDPFPLPLE
eukprot:scaffold115_cov172-Amphora_coffeaeformis.AAC.12